MKVAKGNTTKHWAAGVALLLSLASAPATAGYIVELEEVGSNVVATGSGPIDLTGLFEVNGGVTTNGALNPSLAIVAAGSPMFYRGWDGPITGPSNFGSGLLHIADSTSGDAVVLFHGILNQRIGVRLDYTSGDPLSNTATYLNQDFDSLGVTPGTYVWSWGTGPNQNFTLVIEETAAAAPAPATLALLGLGLAGLGWSRRKK